jgi:uncharacterized membrane protein
MIVAPAAVGTTGFLKENVAGALAYVTFIPAVIFLRVRPYNRNHFVRFHSFQSIFFLVVGIVCAVAMRLIFSLLSLVPRFGYLLASLAVLVVALGWVILWLVVLVKALQGELFKLPVIGDFAEKA